MSDDAAGLLAPVPKVDVRTAKIRRGLPSIRLGWTGTAVTCLAAFTPVALYMSRYEGGAANQSFVAVAILLTAALLVLATRRPLVAAVAVPALIGIVVSAGAFKHQTLQMNLHAYDVVFYLTSPSTVGFMWGEYRAEFVKLIAALTAVVSASVIAYRMDSVRVPRIYSSAAVCALIAATAIVAHTKGARSHTQQYWPDLTLSTFFSSIADTAETLWKGQLIEAAPHGGAPLFTIPKSCRPDEKPPHIILIHQESVVPPSLVPGVTYDQSLDPLFRSFDSQMHPMRVETYGGASWLTEFSILTGVSTYSFGGMRSFVHSLMSGKVRDTLPQALARCGYRNVVLFPGDKNFVSYAKFYAAAGMPEIRDIRDMKGSRINERDRFFYGQALDVMGEHFKSSRQPLFTYVLTMATHGPYDRTYMPEVDVPGGGPGTNAEMHEYLRRLSMARADYDGFVADLKRRFPKERFLIVHYGDHHPTATRAYLGQGKVEHPQDVVLPRDSIGFLTYFAVQGINHLPPPLPTVDVLDVPYLGTLVLEAARLPLSDAALERKRLMTVCRGRYFGCSDQQEILAFHRRLIDSGLLDSR
ncbi:MAG: sulfatase-like hydrolase/transferase [Hyphomicrobium sp.]